jgi:hypothetical protein
MGGVDLQIRVFLASALLGSEWSASRPCRSILGESASSFDGEDDGWIGKDLAGNGCASIGLLSGHLSARTEESHEKNVWTAGVSGEIQNKHLPTDTAYGKRKKENNQFELLSMWTLRSNAVPYNGGSTVPGLQRVEVREKLCGCFTAKHLSGCIIQFNR